MRAIVFLGIKGVASVKVQVCYLSEPESGPAAPADFGCPQKCHCRYAASRPQVMASGFG